MFDSLYKNKHFLPEGKKRYFVQEISRSDSFVYVSASYEDFADHCI